MEAMALRGVDEDQIDKIILDFENHLNRYQDVIRAGESGFESTTSIAEREDRELRKLEEELLAPASSAAEKESDETRPEEAEEKAGAVEEDAGGETGEAAAGEEEEEEDREVMLE
jgi:hypothetical protein